MGRPSIRPGRVVACLGRRVLGEDEAGAVAAGLLHHEQRQPPVGLGPVGVGAGQEHEHVGPGRERAPRLHPVDQPATVGRAWPR